MPLPPLVAVNSRLPAWHGRAGVQRRCARNVSSAAVQGGGGGTPTLWCSSFAFSGAWDPLGAFRTAPQWLQQVHVVHLCTGGLHTLGSEQWVVSTAQHLRATLGFNKQLSIGRYRSAAGHGGAAVHTPRWSSKSITLRRPRHSGTPPKLLVKCSRMFDESEQDWAAAVAAACCTKSPLSDGAARQLARTFQCCHTVR